MLTRTILPASSTTTMASGAASSRRRNWLSVSSEAFTDILGRFLLEFLNIESLKMKGGNTGRVVYYGAGLTTRKILLGFNLTGVQHHFGRLPSRAKCPINGKVQSLPIVGYSARKRSRWPMSRNALASSSDRKALTSFVRGPLRLRSIS